MEENEKANLEELAYFSIEEKVEEMIKPIIFVGDSYKSNESLNQLFLFPHKFQKDNALNGLYGCGADTLVMAKHYILMNLSEAIIAKIADVLETYLPIHPYLYTLYEFTNSNKIYSILDQATQNMSEYFAPTINANDSFYRLSNALFSATVLVINSFIQDFCSIYVFGVGEYLYNNNPLYAVIYKMIYNEEIDVTKCETSRANQYSTCTAVMREMFESEMESLGKVIKVIVGGAYGVWYG